MIGHICIFLSVIAATFALPLDNIDNAEADSNVVKVFFARIPILQNTMERDARGGSQVASGNGIKGTNYGFFGSFNYAFQPEKGSHHRKGRRTTTKPPTVITDTTRSTTTTTTTDSTTTDTTTIDTTWTTPTHSTTTHTLATDTQADTTSTGSPTDTTTTGTSGPTTSDWTSTTSGMMMGTGSID